MFTATVFLPLRRIRKGTNIIEYLGERISHELADARYAHTQPLDGHTFLFTVDAKTVIDAGINGNEARFVNHGCDPNCQTVQIGKRIFIEAVRTIRPVKNSCTTIESAATQTIPPISIAFSMPVRR